MSRAKLWICDVVAEVPPQGEIVDLAQAVVLARQRIFFRAVTFTAPNFNHAYKAAKIMARTFFPADQGYINQDVSGLTELDPLKSVKTLLEYGAITVADLKGLIEGK
jgi:hypothetical protein